jgi:O-antigen/teichoic acid export membrane protein
VISVFAGGSIMLYGGYFIERWLGPAFADTQRVVLILGLPFIFAMAQNPGIYLLYGLSRQERLLRLNVIEAVINFGLSVALAFPFGIFGVAAGTAVAMLITKTVLQPTIVCEESGLSRRVYYFALMLRPMLVTALPMLLAYAVCVTWLRPVYWQIALACAGQTFLVAPVVWWFVFGEDGRAALTGMVARRAA